MKKYWQTKNMDIVVITDQSEAQPLQESLQKNLPSPMSYSNNLKARSHKIFSTRIKRWKCIPCLYLP
jgi:hypothetical protein